MADSDLPKKMCRKCRHAKPATTDFFQRNNSSSDGLRATCKGCGCGNSAAPAERAEDVQRRVQKQRLGSDFAALKPEDFAVGVGNRPAPIASKVASAEKRQEWSQAMGKFAGALRGDGPMDKDLGEYIGALAEQERRFSNRRLSRSVSISAAHAELSRELFKATARQFFSRKITATGYALKRSTKPQPRTVNILFSDLHLGAAMDERANPLPFRAIEEARRLEYVVRQVLDYKPQYRAQSKLRVYLNGDIVDGMLMHDQRAGLPLTEQKAVFWHHFRIAMAHFAAQYPSVEVECQPGNHGRNIARHPGRATEDKWDGIEWDMYYALAQMCSGLANVKFSMPFRAVSVVDLYGSKLLLTHGDTEPGFGDPDSASEKNAATMAQINSSMIYGEQFACYAVGHWHKGRYLATRDPQGIFNGALVPPNGHARSNRMIGEKQGQTLWESVEGYPIGDLRFVVVGPAQDKDERLGLMIPPFRFPDGTR
jgi:hypothetical protein